MALVLATWQLVVAGTLGIAQSRTPATSTKTTPATVPAPDKSLGSRSAPIKMEVFSDFQCPSCKFLFEGTLRQVMVEYVATGKVYLIHRDMPLPIHRYSQDAARYANAAATLGKFEKVAEAIYRAQESWSVDGTRLEAVVAAVLTQAEMKRVRTLLTNPAIQSAIDKDVALARSFNVTSTPTVVVTHKGQSVPLPSGGVTYPLLKTYFDQLLR